MWNRGAWLGGCWGLILLVGCGGKAGEGPAESRPAPSPPTAEIPYPPDPCAQYGLQHDDSLPPDACPEVGCDCDGAKLPVPTGLGCVVAVDCAAACTGSGSFAWVGCAISRCRDDGTCLDQQRCLTPPGWTRGFCGEPDQHCFEGLECPPNLACVVEHDGRRACVMPGDRSPCNSDEHCPDGNCVLTTDFVVGVCSSGQVGDACATAADCQRGFECGGSACTDGNHGNPCSTDSDCRTGACRSATCVDGRDSDYCEADQDCDSGICVYGIRCSAGELDAMCEFDSDCLSGICAGNNSDSACTDGATGSKCIDDADCASGACTYDATLRPGSHFGACD
jgi:hypothetical protein